MWNDKRKKYIKSIEHRLISSRSIYLVKVQYIWITDWDFNRGNPNERTNTCRAEFCECWFPERDLLDLKGHRLWSLVNPPESSNTFGFLSTLLLVLLTGGLTGHHQSNYYYDYFLPKSFFLICSSFLCVLTIIKMYD